MLKSEIEVGRDYGFRDVPAARGKDLLRVTIEDPVAKGRWLALWHDGPQAGKRTVISSGSLVTDWEDAAALVEEERKFLALMESSDSQWSPSEDEPLLQAASIVLTCTGELGTDPLDYSGWLRGHLAASRRPFERCCSRAGVSPDFKKLDPRGFVDRRGNIHIGFEAALQLAKRFAAAEPEIVLACVGEYSRENLKDPSLINWTVRSNAAHAIARGWAEGRTPVEGARGDSVRLEDLEDEWIRPFRELQLLALHCSAERERHRQLLKKCAEELRRKGSKGLLLEVNLLLGTPLLPDLSL